MNVTGLVGLIPQARLPIYHFDAYRLRTEGEFIDLGVHEYFEGNGVCFVEWADRVEECLPDQFLKITVVSTGETTPRITIKPAGGGMLRSWKALPRQRRES